MAKRSTRNPDRHLEKLLSKIGSEFELEVVPVQPESYAAPLACYFNVEEKVRRDGGKSHYGWLIHETQLLCEAERHVVWENDEGDLVDVTPHEPCMHEVRFVPDNTGVYTGKLVDNIRVNRTKNPLVDDFILLAEAVSQARAYGTQVSATEYSIPKLADIIGNAHEKMKQDLYAFISQGGQLYTACYCGEGRTYKSCHGSQLSEHIATAMKYLQTMLGNPT